MKNKNNRNLSMKEIQDISFDILKTIKKICEKENIKYVLAFGTLLGAVRHKGYIPWDDDVDIMMTRPDFERFYEYCELHKKELYPYEIWNRSKHPDYPYTMSRMIDKRYILDVENERSCGMGVFVDIYVMDGAGNSIEEAKMLLNKTKKYPSGIFLATRRKLKNGGTKGFWKNLIKPLYFLYVKLKGRDYFEKKLYKIINSQDYLNSSYLACLEWDNTTASAMAKEDIENPQYLEFNNEEFYVPRDYDKYLRNTYGDYMCLPPIKDRKYHHLYKAYRKSDIQ